jgi:hypothetical protein
MTLPGWSAQIERYGVPDETYALRIEGSHQAPRLVPFDVEHDTSWGATLDVDPDSITSVAVVDSQGPRVVPGRALTRRRPGTVPP